MDTGKLNACSRIPVLFLAAAVFLLLITGTGSAYMYPYSVASWSGSPPVSEAKLPVPVEAWQVPPVTLLLAITALFLPFCLVPFEILLSCTGFLSLNFRRVRKRAVLENDWRARIYRYIAANPGSGFAEIMRSFPVNRGTLHYHLGILCRERLIVSFSVHRRTYLFQNSGTFSVPEMDAITRLRNRAGLPICRVLARLPEATREDIARILQVTGSTVSWHMRRLCDAQVVTAEREGRSVRYRLSPAAVKAVEELG